MVLQQVEMEAMGEVECERPIELRLLQTRNRHIKDAMEREREREQQGINAECFVLSHVHDTKRL